MYDDVLGSQPASKMVKPSGERSRRESRELDFDSEVFRLCCIPQQRYCRASEYKNTRFRVRLGLEIGM